MKIVNPFHVVDVFAETPYQGNQLAVVLEADNLSSESMQRIALEMNYSETTFVCSDLQAGGGYDTRIYTPAQELPFAGHPTLGTAWVIRNHIATNAPRTIHLNLGVGMVPVSFEAFEDDGELPWFTAPPVEFGPIIQRDQIAAALNLSPEDIDDRAPVQQLSAGIFINCVPLVSLAALERAQMNLKAFAPLNDRGLQPFVHLFCTETLHEQNDLCARFFFDAYGVREDSATGSATACLGAYLVRHRYLSNTDLSLRIEQGHMINRPSLLLLRTRETDGVPEVHVGGKVIETMRGRLL